MARRKRDYTTEMQDSANYLVKLSCSTQERKKENTLGHHRFLLQTHCAELRGHRAKYEQELTTFMNEKQMTKELAALQGMERNRGEDTHSIQRQLCGLKELIMSLQCQKEAVLKLRADGQEDLAVDIWQQRVSMVKNFIEELHEDFKDREATLSTELSELGPMSVFEAFCPEPDDFIDSLPLSMPGVHIEKIKQEYSLALNELDSGFFESLSGLEDPAHSWSEASHEHF